MPSDKGNRMKLAAKRSIQAFASAFLAVLE
jgi:hypothetical protein